MNGNYKYIALLTLFFSCSDSVQVSETLDRKPAIVPDYADITIPANIAPLNFSLKDSVEDAQVVLSYAGQQVEVRAKDNQFVFPISKWKKLLSSATGNTVEVVVRVKERGKWLEYAPVKWSVAAEPIDPYIAYRLIAPGYTLWNKMGLYQRNLENYTETPIIENKMSGRNCVNCHSFCMQNPDKMLFHMRETYPGTILVDGDKIEKLNTKTEQTISSLVYPSWHPSGKYVAFSVNNTKQGFHANDRNRIEVFDEASDVVVYDVVKHEVVTTARLFSKDAFETFPTFSPDGKTLYFCTAVPRPIPEEYSEIKYSLCSIGFDPDTRSFGSVVDTLYNASVSEQSASFPRVSPDGKHLMYTLSGYGNFSIWHKDADLYMADLSTGESTPLDILNSDDVESYHSWSSNSRWVIFSSRRIDGLYTRLYIAYIDENGQACKPFLLPQKDTGFYDRFMMSYNIPEFITGKVKVGGRVLGLKAKEDKGIDVKFVK
ncbi:hypothetical protein [uncultured Parabacteroides sp.]|uniref:TolB family protein n=1 Tax=uncultured Parabacteroides sp. TaxID=512312 RepID=UPI00259BBC5E|nr:hypothetical protein [uncultured Parabacteroides sp.]